MNFQIFLVLICVHRWTMMEMKLAKIKTELQNNILKFGYGINYKCVGMVSHSFDRFYVVTKFELPKTQDLKFNSIPYDKGCNHLEELKTKGGYNIGMIDEIKQYYVKIVPHIDYYRKQIEYYNQTTSDILTNEIALKPSVLDGRHEIILANWPNTKYMTCNDNHNYPIKISSHLYVLQKRTVLCNCAIHAENHFLLESLAACPAKQTALTMYYTVNAAFMHYFDSLKKDLEITDLDAHISQNWTSQEQVISISLQTLEIDL